MHGKRNLQNLLASDRTIIIFLQARAGLFGFVEAQIHEAGQVVDQIVHFLESRDKEIEACWANPGAKGVVFDLHVKGLAGDSLGLCITCPTMPLIVTTVERSQACNPLFAV